MVNYTIFISDLHLHSGDPLTARCFVQFLQKQAAQADTLYILGDFFDSWVGDDDDSPFNQSIKAALKACITGGTPIYLLPGNRDFLLGPRFADETGCQLLGDPTRILLYDTPALLTHGDMLFCPGRLHLWFRQQTQKAIIQRLFLALPLWLRKGIARLIRHYSQKRHVDITPQTLAATPKNVIQTVKEHHVSLLIHGHVHHAGIYAINTDNLTATRISLDHWFTTGNALRYESNGEYTFLEFCKEK